MYILKNNPNCKKYLAILFICSSFFSARSASALSDNHTLLSDVQQRSYQTLQANTSNFFGSANEAFSVPNFLYGEPLFKPKNSEDSYEKTINNFFQTYPDLFQVIINDFRIEVEKPKDRNITQVHLFQKYQNVPVFGAEVIFTFNEKSELISYLGKYVPSINMDVKPKTTSKEIKNIIAKDLKVGTVIQEPRLFIFNKGVLTDTKESTQLVWRLGTNGWVYFIDANTQEIVYKYEDLDNVLTRAVYTAGGGTPTLPGTSVISEGDDTDLVADDDAVDAYNYSGDVYNYFYTNFNLNSYDDAGSSMVSTVDYDTSNLARWCNYLKSQDVADCPGFQGVLFYNGYTVLDITAHEWTHAVDDYAVLDEASELYGLTMSGQSGALNESYSDIFGVLIEAEYGSGLDWDIGESSPIGMIRNLADPTTSASPQPDDWSGYDSNADSHYNSGIPNKAAYLIMRDPSEGIETFNNVDVTGIGLDKAENIFYYTLRDELITSATFDDNFNALLQTCLTLDTITIDTQDCESIFDAYAAIGINADSSYLIASAIATPVSGYAPLTVNFDGSDSFALNANIVNYSWDLNSNRDSNGDGNFLNDVDNTGPVASYTYNTVGSVNAWLTVTDNTGNTSEDMITVVVTNPIEPSFSQTGDGLPAPAAVSFDASGTVDHSGTITNYSWNFGDSSISNGASATRNHSYASNGNYNVVLTVTDNAGYTNTTSHMVYVGTTNPTSITGTIYNDTWTAARSPYVINGSVAVASGYTLTIEPGTVIKFLNTGSYLTVIGTLNAVGTATDQIIFTSIKDDTYGGDTNNDGNATTPAAGNWYYVRTGTGSATANLDYVTMQYGGYSGTPNDYGMFFVDNNTANVTVDHSTLRYSQYHTVQINSGSTSTITNSTISHDFTTTNRYGVYITGGIATLTGNTISSVSSYGMYINNASPTIDGNTVSNSAYGIGITGASATPTVTDNTFAGNGYPISITSLHPSITLTGNTGSGNVHNSILLSGTMNGDFTLDMTNDLIYTFSTFSVPSGYTLTIEPGTVIKFGNTSSAMSVAGTLDAQGTDTEPIIFTSIKDDAYGGDTNNDGNATSPAAGDWYYMWLNTGSTAILDYTTIRYGGTTDHSTDYPMLMLYSNTATVSNSTISDSEYDLIGINGNSTISDSFISDVGINHCAVCINSGSPTLNANKLFNNGRGVYVSGAATPTVTNNSFRDNIYPVYLNAINNGMTLSGNDGSNNSVNGIILNGSVSGNFELNMANDLLYILAAVYVPAGNTLTVAPGTVVKFHLASYGSYTSTLMQLAVFGTLDAQGTAAEPIVFTSYQDDTYGGDTNGDGNASSPTAGDWNDLTFASGSTVTISHALIQYGGTYDTWSTDYPMIWINTNNATITDSTISDSEYHIIQISGASPTITNSTIQNSGSVWVTSGIEINGGSPTITNNTITDTHYGVITTNGAQPTVTGNRIDGNGYGIYGGSVTAPITAENNWWGDASGSYNATSNPTGTGDNVSDNVDFNPWLTADPNPDLTPPAEVTLRKPLRNVWIPAVQLRWTNPTDADFDHVRIDRFDGVTTTTIASNETGITYFDTTVNFNTFYTYILYTVDTAGNVSSGSSSPPTRLRNPAPATLMLTRGNSLITAAWLTSSAPSSTLGGYIVYYGTALNALTNTIDVGNVTTTTLTGLTGGTTYYVAVVAYNHSGVQSSPSSTSSAVPRP